MPENSAFPNVPTVPIVGQGNTPIPSQRRKPGSTEIDQKLLFARNQAVFRRIQNRTVRSGALITFQYGYWKHDPYPLILCSGVWGDGKIAGANLHYLTFRNIKQLIDQSCGRSFNYKSIAGNKFIQNSFRCYKRDGVKNLRLLDCEFLMWMLTQVRSFNVTEVEAIRQWVQAQIRQRMNQLSADELQRISQQYSQEYPDMLKPDLAGKRYGSYNLPQDFGNQKRPTFDQGQ